MSLADLVDVARARQFVRRLVWGPAHLGRIGRRDFETRTFHSELVRDDRRWLDVLTWEAARIVDEHRQRLRGRLGLRIHPAMDAEERRALARGEGFLVQGRFTRWCVPIREGEQERTVCYECGGTGRSALMFKKREISSRPCDECDGKGYRLLEHDDYPTGADVLAFAPGQLDGRWWAEFKSRSDPSWGTSYTISGATLAEIFASVAKKGVLVS